MSGDVVGLCLLGEEQRGTAELYAHANLALDGVTVHDAYEAVGRRGVKPVAVLVEVGRVDEDVHGVLSFCNQALRLAHHEDERLAGFEGVLLGQLNLILFTLYDVLECVGLCILAVALAAGLVLGGIVLMRFILLTRKQKKLINLANENNALKAKFISNISAQLNPTLHKLDAKIPEVKALLDFSEHIATLSDLENTIDQPVELADVQLTSFCDELVSAIKSKVNSGVVVKTNVPALSVNMNKEYVQHILQHLLANAAIYAPKDGTIWLEYKKRGAHVHQFLVSNTGEPIPEDKRDDVFKPFTEVKDFTEGDGLGLPICKQMAIKMKGDLDIDPEFTKGTRFVLLLHS